jgi:hypothetical protein
MNPLFRDSFPSSGAGGPPADTPQRRIDYRRLIADAREALREGRIPSRPADELWGGAGSGGPCAICNAPLERHEVEYELQFTHGLESGAYHVHVACCMAWEAELS